MDNNVYVMTLELDNEELDLMKNAIELCGLLTKIVKSVDCMELCEYLKFKMKDVKKENF